MAKMMGKTINWGRWWIDRSTAGAGRAAEAREWQGDALMGLCDHQEDPAPWDHAGQCRKVASDYARAIFKEER